MSGTVESVVTVLLENEELSRKAKVWFWFIILLALVPIITFPLSSDHTIYLRGGESILSGGKLYKDFIDVKPPLLYYMFAAIRFLFGSGEYAVRYADVLWQIGTIAVLIRVAKAVGVSAQAAYTSGIVYAISYVVLGYVSVMHCESFAAPAFAGLLYYQLKGKRVLDYIIIGVLLGWIVSLKFTFAITIVPLLLFDIITRSYTIKGLLRKYTAVTFGGIVAVLVLCISLLDTTTRAGFIDLLTYLKFYSSQPPFSLEFIKNALKALGMFFGDYYSLGFVVLFLIGVTTAFSNFNKRIPILRSNLILQILLIIIALLISIVAERKFLPNHYVRLYPLLTIVVGIGFVTVRQYIVQHWQQYTLVQKSIVWCLVCTALAFTPFPRLSKIALISYGYFFSPDIYNAQYNQESNIGMEEFQRRSVVRYITSHKKPNDKTLIIAIGQSQMYESLQETPWTVFGHSQFYFSQVIPQWWQIRFHKEITMSNWIVVSTNDVYPFLNGHDRTSWQSLQQDSAIYPYFTQHFRPVLPLRSMTLYQRVEPDSIKQ